ncbi:unnamed protein product [Penicillium roqueforti FM164]|uniref:Genomic scaffold, ProqFM164S02 n=1 Tax=Penicillium roqueforti (strain FM164) TaxID=1365484 RepID=W6Q2B9_PENRF|nr:unnamed protein product [Penicillium roqueforti FM164]
MRYKRHSPRAWQEMFVQRIPGEFQHPQVTRIQCSVRIFVICLPASVDMQIAYSIAGEYNYL